MRAVGLVLVVAMGATVRADPARAPKPWAAGVSDAEQTEALAIYNQGNAQFEEARYAQALAMYREAIKHWDHPAIRFNMVVCLVNLDQPIEALDDLDDALKYGDAPFGAEVYAQGLTYKKLLLAQLAKVDVTSDERGADVNFDGAKLFTAPGKVTKVVAPGSHQIVATKPGFLTTTLSLSLVGGGKTTIADIKMSRLERTRIGHRWSAWKPWAVVGGGAVVVAIGGYLDYRSYKNFASYNSSFEAMCANGCGGPSTSPIPASLASLKHRATVEDGAAVAMFSLGGLALAAGAVGVYLNQAHPVHEKNITITPAVGPNTAAVLIGGSF